jgi:choline dehydrogenase
MTAAGRKTVEYEYIVVGSGAGGGTVAARLAEAGRRVLLLEAGGDPLNSSAARLPEDYQIPAFHAFASENPALRWDFFVRHYTSDERQKKDPKFTADQDGVLYPRAGTLGGCTAHNAMILVYPHNADWNAIADSTGDVSWNAANMRKYFERLEDCRHRPPYRWLRKLLGLNPTRHGFAGWLPTERPRPPKAALRDRDMMEVIERSGLQAIADLEHPLKRLIWFLRSQADPNDWRIVRRNAFGIRYAPLTTLKHRRMGSRERVLAVARRHPDKLHLELNALTTRVLLDASNRAAGVEYLKGERLYRAHAQSSHAAGEKHEARASREIILSGGAFNTPQLLMLSGIGPKKELQRHGIGVRVDLPGVGTNLQDRYEVGVVNRMKDDWEVLARAEFAKGDPQYRQWAEVNEGAYIGNGAMLVVIKKSQPMRELPDLFCMGMLARFEGYFPGYSQLIARHHNYLTWIVLKARTRNNAGTVTLRSTDPRDPPEIKFRYFEEGSDTNMEDLDAVVDGIKFVRRMSHRLKQEKLIAAEELPGEHIQSDDDLRDFVRHHAWGHHASCTCPIGSQEKGGVLASDFRVHGTHGLRVVDASVFPRIPGFFIVSAVYMIGEKAADVILADAK